MKAERQFIAPMRAVEAAERAKYVLGKWKFKYWAAPRGIRFERSVPFSGLVAINPHHVHCRLDMTFAEREDGSCQVTVNYQVFRLGRPGSKLDNQVWLGDLEDLEANLVRREEPKIDRARQDKYAGALYFRYVLATVTPAAAAGTWLALTGGPLGALLCVAVLIAAVLLIPFLPYRMPHFPLDNQVPSAPFTSNYPRMGS